MTGPVTLRDPAERVSPRAPLVWAAGAVVRGLFLGAALFVASVVAELFAMPLYRYRMHRWETTERAVYTQTGWLSRERRIAPMSRVQTVDFEQGVVARMVGLATVTVTTASAAGALRIEGLAVPVAHQLVSDLTRRADLETGDAT
jgi:membrane protein YdbS with pleckstrin-like domain